MERRMFLYSYRILFLQELILEEYRFRFPIRLLLLYINLQETCFFRSLPLREYVRFQNQCHQSSK